MSRFFCCSYRSHSAYAYSIFAPTTFRRSRLWISYPMISRTTRYVLVRFADANYGTGVSWHLLRNTSERMDILNHLCSRIIIELYASSGMINTHKKKSQKRREEHECLSHVLGLVEVHGLEEVGRLHAQGLAGLQVVPDIFLQFNQRLLFAK